MVTTMEGLNTFNGNGLGALAGNSSAHGIQEICQVDDLRLSRTVLENGGAFRQRCCHENVLCTTHGAEIEHKAGTLQASVDRRLYVAIFHFNGSTQGLQAAQVLINGSWPNGAATGQGNLGATIVGKHGTKHQKRCTHLPHQVIRRCKAFNGIGMNLNIHLLVNNHLNTQ